MKVLLVIPSISTGGPQLGALKLIREFKRQTSIEVGILSAKGHFRYDKNLANDYLALGAQIHFLPYWHFYDRFPYRFARFLSGLIESLVAIWIIILLRSHPYDLINTHTQYAIDVVTRVAAILKIPTVHTFQGAPDQGRIHRLRRAIGSRPSRVRRRAFTAVSEATRQEYVNSTPLSISDVLVIPNGVDLSMFSAYGEKQLMLLRKELSLGTDCVVFGSVGRLSPEKGYRILIQAAKMLSLLQHRFSVVIVGDGPDRENLNQLIVDNQLSERVQIIGFRTDIPALLQLFDVFVLSSYTEGLSNALLEAMSCGLPCIATDVGGNTELLRDGRGILVKANSESLFDAMCVLLEKPESRAHYGFRARESSTEYSMQTIAEKYLYIYSDLLESRPKIL